jgi:hypothetical protein
MDRDVNAVGPRGRRGIELADGEAVIMDAFALHVVGIAGVGVAHSGHLWLTTSRLVFRAHRVNLFGRSCALAVADVTQLLKYPLHPTDLIVVLANGNRQRFAWLDRDRWIEAIEAVRATGIAPTN